jgi:hypothetical protein
MQKLLLRLAPFQMLFWEFFEKNHPKSRVFGLGLPNLECLELVKCSKFGIWGPPPTPLMPILQSNFWSTILQSNVSTLWNEEANKFCRVTWRNIDWLRWLKENMVNRMPNGRFLISPCDAKANFFFSCVMKSYEKSLVGWNGWMRRWPMRNSHAFLDKMKRLANTFPSVTWRRINWLRWLHGETVKIHFSRHPISWCDMNKLLKRYWLVEKPKLVICS